MSEKEGKKKEVKRLDPNTEDPNFKYEITKEYMLGYVQARASAEDQIWYYEMVLNPDFKKDVTRKDKDGNDKTYTVFDVEKARNLFIEKFFKEKFAKKEKEKKVTSKKLTYEETCAQLLAELKKK